MGDRHGLLRTLGLVALGLTIGKVLRVGAWKMAHGPEGLGWAKERRRSAGHTPSWHRHWERRVEKATNAGEPDVESGCVANA
jgi:hypothetical protein